MLPLPRHATFSALLTLLRSHPRIVVEEADRPAPLRGALELRSALPASGHKLACTWFRRSKPNLAVPSNIATLLLAAAVPLRVNVVALVMPSPTVPLSGEKDVMAGALGTTVSTVTAKAALYCRPHQCPWR